MFLSLPGIIRVPLALLLLFSSTLLHILPLLLLTFVKVLLPWRTLRHACSVALSTIAESWIAVNAILLSAFTRICWRIEGIDNLRGDGNYLVVCNHQSWIDIPVLQKIFNRRIPLMRFFLKRQLIWVPLLGAAWWALDFPFMKRHSRQTLELHPELRRQDLEATRRACEKFRQMPVAIMNFVEGTRFTSSKHQQQRSPYRYLLKPRAGGVAYALEAMGDMLQYILDVTIVYPEGPHSLFDLVAGRVREVFVHVREWPIEHALIGDYENDTVFRERFQQWINALWLEKDVRIGQVQGIHKNE